MADYGLKIALSGNDVGTAGLQQLAFSSQFPIYKIALSGNISFTCPASDGTNKTTAIGTVSHNLGYFPAFRCYAYTDSGATRRQSLDLNANPIFLNSRCTTTNLLIYGYNSGTVNFTAKVFYYIYADAGA